MQSSAFNRCFTLSSCLSFALFLFLCSSSTWAGGLYLQEFGTPSMGTASAGAEAIAVDASTALHNPAGMTRVEGRQFMLAGGAGYMTAQFDRDPSTPFDGGNGGDAGGWVPLMGGTLYAQPLGSVEFWIQLILVFWRGAGL